jgi:hypothetical protein
MRMDNDSPSRQSGHPSSKSPYTIGSREVEIDYAIKNFGYSLEDAEDFVQF